MSESAEERDLLAAEYALGTLDPSTAQSVAERIRGDLALAAVIRDWERRLAPLSLLAQPVAPPDSLWQRLAASAGAVVEPPEGVVRLAWRSLAAWRSAAAVGFALAVALAVVLWLRPPPARPVAALVPAGSAAAAYLAELEPNGRLRLVALRPVPVAAGKQLELWALPKGAKRPIALGLLPANGRKVRAVPAPAQGTQLLISLEPKGGSPTGLPTGPVLFGGTLQGRG
ncbi:MAG: anti-sigma factor [Steroidobacteraceae bacterium]